MSLEQRLADSARTLDAAIDTHVARSAATGRSRVRRHRLIGVAAATVLGVGGSVGLYELRAGSHPSAGPKVASGSSTQGTGSLSPDVTVAGETPLPDLTSGSLLATAVPAGVRPLMAMGQSGWTVEKFSGFEQGSPSNAGSCSDCNSERLVVAADGPLFSGAIFTARIVDANYDDRRGEYPTPVTVGTTAGRMDARQDGVVPASENSVGVVWPIGDGRTAIVAAYGLSSADVLAMAASLTFDTSVPTMTTPPAGYSVRPATGSGESPERVGMKFVNGDRVVRIYATNTGFQGLVDGRGPSDPIASGWVPQMVDGATIAFFTPTPGEPPTTSGAFATWIAGGWSYEASGTGFGSDSDFLDVISSLHLTDNETFTASCARAVITPTSSAWFNS